MSELMQERGEEFAERLKRETAPMHESAEGADFVRALMSGELDAHAMGALLGQTYYIYEALEQVSERLVDDPIAGPFVDSRLYRVPTLESGLQTMFGPQWKAANPPLTATAAYCDRIRTGLDEPARFVAHHYLRYLGDLSGGQIIKRMAERHYGLGATELSFYTFDEIEKPKVYKDKYRAKLNSRGWDEATQRTVIDEANAGFVLNRNVFAELSSTRGD